MGKRKAVVFASGSKNGGGSGFQELVENRLINQLPVEIVGVVSNHASGGVCQIASKHQIPFTCYDGVSDDDSYFDIMSRHKAQWALLSGWLKPVRDLRPEHTINIHPGLLPRFGGQGMYGHYVHEAVMRAFKAGDCDSSAVTMHFVTEQYDQGPQFFRYQVLIRSDDTAETLAGRVNKIEHGWQSFITGLVVTEQIRLEGEIVIVPDWYKACPFCPAELAK